MAPASAPTAPSGAANSSPRITSSFDRYARLRPVLLAGGDSGVREPWRVARSYLLDTFGAIPDSPRWSAMASPERLRVIDAMLTRRVNTIPTSSAGRLFDAVASLIGLRHTVSFEGQAAMMLEAAADAHPAILQQIRTTLRSPALPPSTSTSAP